MKVNLTKIYEEYKGLWVVLDQKLRKVIFSGKSAESVYKEAIKQGYKKPTLFKVPQQNLPYFGYSSFLRN